MQMITNDALGRSANSTKCQTGVCCLFGKISLLHPIMSSAWSQITANLSVWDFIKNEPSKQFKPRKLCVTSRTLVSPCCLVTVRKWPLTWEHKLQNWKEWSTLTGIDQQVDYITYPICEFGPPLLKKPTKQKEQLTNLRVVAQSVWTRAEEERVLGSRPNVEKTWKVVWF